MKTQSFWDLSANLPRFEPLSNDLEVDVVVIGGGLTGITAAYLMKKAGARVALLERNRVACCDTGHTTAHLTYVTDARLCHLVKEFGRDAARAFWEAGMAGMDQIDAIVRELKLDCEFKWIPGYLHQSLVELDPKDAESLERDAQLAAELGFEGEFILSVPYAGRAGVRFAHQAKFHPLKYLSGVVQQIPGDGSFVFENSEAGQIEGDPLTVRCRQNKVRCRYLMIATHTPLMGKTGAVSAALFQSKLALYTSYVLGARLPKDLVPEALFWDTTSPYYYLRVDRQGENDYAIFGGEDCKTGQEKDPNAVFERLGKRFKQFLPAGEVIYRWMGQVVETNDGLPFIGESAGNQFIATGFCGNGFTLGTLSAVMARDRYLGKSNPWFDLFAVDRKKFHGGTWRYIKENLDYPFYLIRDRLAPAEIDSIDQLPIGEGRIVRLHGKKFAAYRDESGKVNLASPICTHLKCVVHWNAVDKTWDCPCHGSRFRAGGEVFSGPAEEPLEKMPWPNGE